MGPSGPGRAQGDGGSERGEKPLIHLDTGFLIQALRRGSRADRCLRGWLADGEPIGISSVSWTEFLCGPVGPDEIALALRVLGEPVPSLPEDSGMAARLFNETGRRRGSLNDCMIAATAIRVDASIATTDVADFRRFEPAGLRVLTVG